jgi:hypothetical protein
MVEGAVAICVLIRGDFGKKINWGREGACNGERKNKE